MKKLILLITLLSLSSCYTHQFFDAAGNSCTRRITLVTDYQTCTRGQNTENYNLQLNQPINQDKKKK